jgi:hypothetical protein
MIEVNTLSAVVPAYAGTHSHKWWLCQAEVPACLNN